MHALRLLFPRHWRPVLSIQNFPCVTFLQCQQFNKNFSFLKLFVSSLFSVFLVN